MSRDAEAKVDPKTARLFDKRTVERNIKRGLVSRKDYEKYLKSLDDIADKGVYGAPAEDEPDDDEDTDAEAESPSDAGHEGNSHT
jgi:hypothetical protein